MECSLAGCDLVGDGYDDGLVGVVSGMVLWGVGLVQTNILILDSRQYGQAGSVVGCVQGCLKVEGISYAVTERVERAIDKLADFGTVLLGGAAGLDCGQIEAIKNYVRGGGRLVSWGPLGADEGIAEPFAELFGVKRVGTSSEALVPILAVDVEPFEKDEALLFLHDVGVKQVMEVGDGKVVAGSLRWNSETGRYVDCENVSIVCNEFGKGRALYCNLGLGDRKRIPALISGQTLPADQPCAEGVRQYGYPLVRDSEPELAIFLLSLIRLIADRPLAWVGHWPGGWQTVVSLTGDVHEKEEYGRQVHTMDAVAECLRKHGLEGLFTFTVTGKAVEEDPQRMHDLLRRGYDVVPHSAYTATWMSKLSGQEQEEQIDKCWAVYREVFGDSDRLLGWRGHAWGSNGDTERLLEERGCLWISDLIAQCYGDFGESDFHVSGGQGVGMISLPEREQGKSIVRLSLTCYSIWWIGLILGKCYGVSGDPSKGGAVWDLACKLVEEKFYKDIRFGALHLSDWHPEEEFVRVGQFGRTFEHMCEVWVRSERVGIMQATDVAKWWLWREQVSVEGVELAGEKIVVDCEFGAEPGLANPTIRLDGVEISRVILENGREWRYFGKDWISLPVGVAGAMRVTIMRGSPAEPVVVDTTSVVKQACWQDDELRIVVLESRRAEGRMRVYLPQPSCIFSDGEQLEKGACGYQTVTYSKGEHSFVISAGSG